MSPLHSSFRSLHPRCADGYGAGSCYRLAPYPFSHGACIPRHRYLRLVYRQEGGFIDIHVYDDNNNRAGQRWDIRSRRTAFSTFNDQQ